MIDQQIKKNIFPVGIRDWDRRLFDSLIPLPDGTSYNSYLIKGKDKVALIDTVDAAMPQVLLENLKELDVKSIDYVISHHAEQDHSGSLPQVLAAYPMAKVVTNAKCRDLLIDEMHISPDKFQVIEDRGTLSLGDRTLTFIFAPWVHWPETMFTYIPEDKLLFTCDFLGSHLATSDLFATDEAMVYEAAKRYYAEIMMPFRINIRKHLEIIKTLAVDMIAPSHGPIYDKPDFILKAYADWSSDNVKNEVVLPYVSMHGSVRAMTEHLSNALIERGVSVKRFELTGTDIGKLAMALVDAATIVVGSPTVHAGAHPQAVYAAFLANALRPKTRFLSIIGSYGWGGKMVEQLASLIPNLKVEIVPPVVIKGLPKAADLKAIDQLADTIVAKHKTLGIL
jgi:flavorubredoxin